MTVPYLALALTGIPAAYRTRGFLRWWIAWEVGMTLALKLIWMRWHVYDPFWRVAEPVSMVLAAGFVLSRAVPQRWPFYALAAAVVHGWAMKYPNRWPNSYLQLEIHLCAFVFLLLGLFMLSHPKRENAAITVLLLVTAASFYPMPFGAMGGGFPHDLRIWLMLVQSGCYGVIAMWQGKIKRPEPFPIRGA